ncbi:MAG: nucleotidyl transferase AbiEii/AbiGii toxin family protein [Flavobacteriales bacterium]|jgi:predicted nucleotidyltransferase component of viral defense system|nr:nucleotidyl transferase AbiEii/AbiGii toxin family protein [Flavobacteriales bacterium]MBK6883322.1 nucleotidyl transferase AbiEii/AbiGii toxin family protein [Flavobacteriales bacterium]MBK7102965.1 nucleotidyl transferase AbiEii/AbiGii toxin family protein [Flavobacteriales bacterium]MBK7113934.1 nucleotidyl transferase AbiEii/AbiGii toxin family protein [Flavobacteriales bacterium]MBK7620675.1 nucleotidyl transferase AbiEii/AbiGii toxin family protein [Flavobacteriales bacterium]
MLHYETVEPGTLAILKRLMGLDALKDFSLVGGTALALRYGHRRSVDLDLFTEGELDQELLREALTMEFGEAFTMVHDQQAKWAIFAFIGDVKVDLVRFPHARVADIVLEDGIRIYADEDIGPMKVEAIRHRAVKKDFWDIDILLRTHGLEWLLNHHKHKYPRNTIMISIPRTLVYFADAEESETPVCLKGLSWSEVKRSISRIVNSFLL